MSVIPKCVACKDRVAIIEMKKVVGEQYFREVEVGTARAMFRLVWLILGSSWTSPWHCCIDLDRQVWS